MWLRITAWWPWACLCELTVLTELGPGTQCALDFSHHLHFSDLRRKCSNPRWEILFFDNLSFRRKTILIVEGTFPGFESHFHHVYNLWPCAGKILLVLSFYLVDQFLGAHKVMLFCPSSSSSFALSSFIMITYISETPNQGVLAIQRGSGVLFAWWCRRAETLAFINKEPLNAVPRFLNASGVLFPA